MSKSNAFETALLNHLLTNADIANIGDATGLRGSTTVGNLYLSLHTADPGEAGTQATNECAYGGYARKSVARTGSVFTVTNNEGALAANQDFPEASSGSETATHWGIGVASAGATLLLYSGAITPNIVITAGVTPRLKAGTKITED